MAYSPFGSVVAELSMPGMNRGPGVEPLVSRTVTPDTGEPSGPVTRPVSRTPVSIATSTSETVLPSSTFTLGMRDVV